MPVLAAGFVETDAGIGLVQVAPVLGPDDFKLGPVNGLPVEESVGADSAHVTTVPHLVGRWSSGVAASAVMRTPVSSKRSTRRA